MNIVENNRVAQVGLGFTGAAQATLCGYAILEKAFWGGKAVAWLAGASGMGPIGTITVLAIMALVGLGALIAAIYYACKKKEDANQKQQQIQPDTPLLQKNEPNQEDGEKVEKDENSAGKNTSSTGSLEGVVTSSPLQNGKIDRQCPLPTLPLDLYSTTTTTNTNTEEVIDFEVDESGQLVNNENLPVSSNKKSTVDTLEIQKQKHESNAKNLWELATSSVIVQNKKKKILDLEKEVLDLEIETTEREVEELEIKNLACCEVEKMIDFVLNEAEKRHYRVNDAQVDQFLASASSELQSTQEEYPITDKSLREYYLKRIATS